MARSGIGARSRQRSYEGRGVYCMPVLPSYTLTHQWVRELRQWKPGVIVAVDVRLPDDELVTVGRYGTEPRRVSAAEAAAVIRALDDPRGWEVFVPRTITAAEIRRVRRIPQHIGWRHLPDAHGASPCRCCVIPGLPKAARARRARTWDLPEPPQPKAELMAALQVATTSDEIISVLWQLGKRRRGGAEELAYLVDHPDPDVRETLAETLTRYRGPVARRLRHQLAEDPELTV